MYKKRLCVDKKNVADQINDNLTLDTLIEITTSSMMSCLRITYVEQEAQLLQRNRATLS